MSTRVEIDGRMGEGGGQVLRSSLALAVATGRPVRVENVRGGRPRPGLLRQHLTAALAVAEVSEGDLSGAELGSPTLGFVPGTPRAGDYHFAVGSAGSAPLVLQTVLPALLLAEGESRVVVEGGTHNPLAPPFDALERSFAPVLARLGVGLELRLERAGFYPAGGGRLVAEIRPTRRPRALDLLERGRAEEHRCEVRLAHLDRSIAEREWRVVAQRLGWGPGQLEVIEHPESQGPGNALSLILAHEHVTEVVSGFGRKNLPAHRVARQAVDRARRYLNQSAAPVGEHLADQLMLPLALLAGGRYRTVEPSRHSRTNAEVLEAFLGPGTVQLERRDRHDWLVRVPTGLLARGA